MSKSSPSIPRALHDELAMVNAARQKNKAAYVLRQRSASEDCMWRPTTRQGMMRSRERAVKDGFRNMMTNLGKICKRERHHMLNHTFTIFWGSASLTADKRSGSRRHAMMLPLAASSAHFACQATGAVEVWVKATAGSVLWCSGFQRCDAGRYLVHGMTQPTRESAAWPVCLVIV